MAVYKRGKSWVADFYFYSRRIRQTGFRTRAEAEEYITGAKHDMLFRNHPVQYKRDISFTELAAKYIEQHSKPSKRSFQSDISVMKKLHRFFGDYYIGDITLDDIDRYKVERKSKVSKNGRGFADGSINRELALIRAMMNKAVEWRMIAYNPIAKLKLFKEFSRNRVLTETELNSLVTHAKGDLKYIVLIAVNAGLRKGEILNLKWQDINLEANYIQTRSKNYRTRKIILNRVLNKMFTQLNKTRNSNTYVFQSPKTGKPYTDIKKSWWSLLKKLKIEDFRFHDLRHCYATYKVSYNTDLRQIQSILGHTQITTTERYVDARLEDQRRDANNFCIGEDEFD